jgi:hypothetical protein
MIHRIIRHEIDGAEDDIEEIRKLQDNLMIVKRVTIDQLQRLHEKQ